MIFINKGAPPPALPAGGGRLLSVVRCPLLGLLGLLGLLVGLYYFSGDLIQRGWNLYLTIGGEIVARKGANELELFTKCYEPCKVIFCLFSLYFRLINLDISVYLSKFAIQIEQKSTKN